MVKARAAAEAYVSQAYTFEAREEKLQQDVEEMKRKLALRLNEC